MLSKWYNLEIIFYYKNEFLGSKKANRLFKELLLYKALIKKLYIKRLDNIDMLRELPVYDELSIVKTWKVFKEYAISYSIEIID